MALFNLQGSTPLSMICNTTTAQYVLVMQDTTKGQVIVTTGITSLPLGVTMQAGLAGETIPIQRSGVAKMTAKAAITLGDQVMPSATAGGKIETSAGATARTIGVALEAAGADGDIIEVAMMISGNGAANT